MKNQLKGDSLVLWLSVNYKAFGFKERERESIMCITLLFWPCMLQQLKKKRNFKQAIDLIVTDYYIYKLVIYLLSKFK